MRLPEFALLLACLASVPAWAGDAAYQRLALQYDLPEQISPAAFNVCAQHDCNARVPVSLNEQQWQQVRARFEPAAQSPLAEREQIAAAVGLMERLVADFADSHHDKGGDFNGLTEPGAQLDCIDESVNTTTYLTLFEQAGLLRWHRVQPRISRGYFFFGGWPHFTAVVETTDAHREQWVVDSWFRDNGVAPDILEVARWKDGWSPPGFSM